MYKVIKNFVDLLDDGYRYEAGDVYPREGYAPSVERIEALKSANNRQRVPLIEEVKASAPKSADKVEEVASEDTTKAPKAKRGRKPATDKKNED